MSKDMDAFVAWMNEDMFGTDKAMTRREFAAKRYMRVEDLEWAFCSGRMSLKQEQAKEGK